MRWNAPTYDASGAANPEHIGQFDSDDERHLKTAPLVDGSQDSILERLASSDENVTELVC